MTFEVAGAALERVLAALGRRQHGLGRGDLGADNEGAEPNPPAVDVADVVGRIRDVGADAGDHRPCRGLERAQAGVEALVQHDAERRGGHRGVGVHDLRFDHVRAVVHTGHVELHRERRLAQVAADAVKRAQLLDQRGRRRRHRTRSRRRPLAQRDLGGERRRQLDRRAVDLLEAQRVGDGRVDHDALTAQRERVLEIERRRPRRAVQQRHAPGNLPPRFTSLAKTVGRGQFLVDGIDLRLELPVRLHRRFSCVVDDGEGADVGQRLRRRQRRDQQKGKEHSFHDQDPSVKAINSADRPLPAATTRYCTP